MGSISKNYRERNMHRATNVGELGPIGTEHYEHRLKHGNRHERRAGATRLRRHRKYLRKHTNQQEQPDATYL